MTEFREGMRWRTYGDEGFASKTSLTLDNGNGTPLTGVVVARELFVAMNAITGSIVGEYPDFDAAIAAAETEALNPHYS